MDECHTFGKFVSVIRCSDLSFSNFCSEKHFSFIGEAQFRRATLSCDSSYSCMLIPFKDIMSEISHLYDMDFCVLR